MSNAASQHQLDGASADNLHAAAGKLVMHGSSGRELVAGGFAVEIDGTARVTPKTIRTRPSGVENAAIIEPGARMDGQLAVDRASQPAVPADAAIAGPVSYVPAEYKVVGKLASPTGFEPVLPP